MTSDNSDTSDLPARASSGAATVIYTDGACSGNPGPGGWAWAVADGASGSGSDRQTTNQRMELTAVLQALEANSGPVEIVSDSTYVVNCFNDKWYEGWLRRNWRNANKKPVANRDLWEPVVEHFQRRVGELSFTWVKGHSGDAMNDLVDAMAVAEVEKLRGEEAERAADAIAARDIPWPNDRAVVVLGARELSDEQSDWLERTIGGLDPSADVVVSGLRRGAELAGAEHALARKIPLAVVLPFADPASGWPASERRRFEAAQNLSQWTVDLEQDRSDVNAALRARAQYLAGAATGAIVVGDEKTADALDGDGLTVIRPTEDAG